MENTRRRSQSHLPAIRNPFVVVCVLAILVVAVCKSWGVNLFSSPLLFIGISLSIGIVAVICRRYGTRSHR
jgi:hypothetical protein